nr:MAG TPA: hypothetical protein [Caudoviricetes sp.]
MNSGAAQSALSCSNKNLTFNINYGIIYIES